MFSYDDIGKGEVLVFLHGLGNRKEAWTFQHPLAERFRLIAPDLIGHGCSPIKEGLTLERATSDVIALLDTLGVEQFHLCGLSLGGIIAQNICRLHRSRVKSLILADTSAYIPYFSSRWAAAIQQNEFEKGQTELFKQKAVKFCFHRQDESILSRGEHAFAIRDDTYIACANMASGYNFYPMLPFLDIPVLIICGEKDRITPVMHSKTMHFFIPKSRLHLMKNTGHLSNVEAPDLFNEQIKLFLSDVKM